MSGAVCGAASTPTAAPITQHPTRITRRLLRAHISSILIDRRIVDADLEKRIVPLAAFAAEAAVNGFSNLSRIHTRHRVLERHAERNAAPDHVGFVRAGVRRVDRERM